MNKVKWSLSAIGFGIIFCIIAFFLINQNGHAVPLKQLLIQANIPEYKFNIINTYPHNKDNFTEGIQLDTDYYYESSGLYNKSKLQKIELKSARIVQEYKLPDQYFGEGLTYLDNKIYQLTYREGVGFVYEKNTFKLLATFVVNGQGWGLTNDGQSLIMSNGSSKLYFLNLKSYKIEKSITVTVMGKEIKLLNELEYIQGKIFANVWLSPTILMISPENGSILGWIDIEGLQPLGCPPYQCVANGILHDKDNTLYVTGKLWPYIYQIVLRDIN